MSDSIKVIIILGLGEKAFLWRSFVNKLNSIENTSAEIYTFGWIEKDKNFNLLFEKFVNYLKEQKSLHEKIHLIGLSAGGSVAVLAKIKYPSLISSSINICGRLLKGENVHPSLEIAAKNYPIFRTSVLECEKQLKNTKSSLKDSILSLVPLFDETVPIETMSRSNQISFIKSPTITHVFSIWLITKIRFSKILKFIRKN
ncbi:hypothetical protein GF389_03250 [Candidatus Dojkabacteria bacterium]|nr:hypothetical protein [Candidatus Dojkabacteria bacterium]